MYQRLYQVFHVLEFYELTSTLKHTYNLCVMHSISAPPHTHTSFFSLNRKTSHLIENLFSLKRLLKPLFLSCHLQGFTSLCSSEQITQFFILDTPKKSESVCEHGRNLFSATSVNSDNEACSSLIHVQTSKCVWLVWFYTLYSLVTQSMLQPHSALR